ncbi:MAG: hypothetical protein JW737_01205 [Acidobacteria bacterium]|nr:hypothetical protein [Acidobacteriota bacterium]
MCKTRTKKDKWIEWLEKITNDSVRLHTDLEMYIRFREIINENINIVQDYHSPAFIYAVNRWFGDFALIKFRKHLKSKNPKKEISFMSILEDIKKEAENKNGHLSRKDYIAKQKLIIKKNLPPTDYASPGFTKEQQKNGLDNVFRQELQKREEKFNRFAEPSDTHFNPDIIQKDIDMFKNKCEKLEKIVDKTIAHEEQGVTLNRLLIPEYKEIIDYFHNLVQTYKAFFTNSSTFSTASHVGDWTWIFHEKLKIPKKKNSDT